MQPAEAKVIAEWMHPGLGYKWHHSMFLGWPECTKSTIWVFASTAELHWSGRRQMSGEELE